ncbi:MAG: hypothetical protein AAGI34_06350 [Pseudomonadota bacterium]
MSAQDDLLSLIEEGHALLGRERADLLAARLDRAATATAEKERFLEALEPAVRRCPSTETAQAALAGLITESRRNERLLQAALTGVRRARRRIAQILATRRGEVAYAADGSRIACPPDTAARNRRA